MRRGAGLVVLALGLGLYGVARPSATYVEGPVLEGGTLVGRVRFTGEPPKGEPLAVRKNIDVCGEHKPSQALVVGPTKGVRGTVVPSRGSSAASGRRSSSWTTPSACSCRTSRR